MRLLILAILVFFPLLEGAVLYKLASEHGGLLLAWLAFATLAGIILIKQARFSLIARLGEAVAQGRFSLAALIDSFRLVLAGLLLIFPGVISDVMALVLVLWPVREPVYARAAPRARHARVDVGGVIEGQFRRES